jgi:CysZ protein
MAACAALAIVVLLGAVGAITWMAAHFVSIKIGWLETLVHWTIGILTGIGGWFMLPALTVLIGGIFQETAIQRVEHIYYPDYARSGPIKFWPDIWHDIQFTLLALSLNILILPFYLVGIGFIASIFLNTYLLGREFFESAAGYHVGKTKAKELGRSNKKVVYGGGLAITLTTLIPFLNLFVPILAIVWMVHAYHKECKLPKSDTA